MHSLSTNWCSWFYRPLFRMSLNLLYIFLLLPPLSGLSPPPPPPHVLSQYPQSFPPNGGRQISSFLHSLLIGYVREISFFSQGKSEF